MTVAEVVINSSQSLASALSAVSAAWERSKYIRLVIRERQRSINQNDQAHVWYGEVSKALREDSPLGVKCESKLACGVPLLCATDPDFREMWEGFSVLTHEQKLALMKWLPVSSLMPVDVASDYLEELRAYWENRGVMLEYKQKRAA